MGFRAIEIAISGMMTHRARAEVAAHNVANVDTPGYARRRLLIESVPGPDFDPHAPGLGVRIVDVHRRSDHLLADQINVEAGGLGRAQARADGADSLEAAIVGSSGRGLSDPLNDLFDAFSQLAADPTSTAARNTVIRRASALQDAFGQVADQIDRALTRNDQRFVSEVNAANALIRRIAQINTEITEQGAQGALGSDLWDQRTNAMRQLAEKTGAHAIRQENGTIDVLLGGHHLVQRNNAYELQLISDPGDPSLHNVSFKGKVPPDALEGTIAGCLDVRDQHIYPAQAAIGDFAENVADAFNAIHAAGYGLDGSTSIDLFEYDPAAPANTFLLNPAVAENTDLIAAASEIDQPGNGDNAAAMAALRTEPPPAGGDSLADTHAVLLAELGHDVMATSATFKARQSVVQALETRQADKTGVQLDEEAMHMQQAQSAYVASQRAAEVALSMLDATLRIGM